MVLAWAAAVGALLFAMLYLLVPPFLALPSLTDAFAAADWTELATDYTVPTDGSVDEVRLRFKVGANLTAGTVWWDQGSHEQAEPGTVDSIIQQILGWTGIGHTHTDAAGALGNLANTVISHSAQIAAMQAAGDTVTAAVDDFERTAAGTLGANWDEHYGSGLGDWDLDGHHASWRSEFSGGIRESVCLWVGGDSTGDYQTNEIVLASSPAKNPAVGYFASNYVIGRCDSPVQSFIRLT